MRIKTVTGQVLKDVVICAVCRKISTNLDLRRCPTDGAVLGETTRTPRQIERTAKLEN